MDATVLALIEDIASSTINFAGDVVTSLWGLFLSLAVLGFAIGFIYRKTAISR